MIHHSALVHPSANVHKTADIGPYCVVGEHAAIGARASLLAHVVVTGRTTIGEDTVIHPFATVGAPTQHRTAEEGEVAHTTNGPRCGKRSPHTTGSSPSGRRTARKTSGAAPTSWPPKIGSSLAGVCSWLRICPFQRPFAAV